MRLCSVTDIKEDMVLGQSIYKISGKLLLGAGIRLNHQMKAKLVERGYSHVHIEDDGPERDMPDDTASPEVSFRESNRSSRTTYDIQNHSEFKSANVLKATALIDRGFLKHSSISYDVKKIIIGLLKDITSSGASVMNSVMIKTADSFFLDHALNVTLISLLIGIKYGLTTKELYSLGLGSFLHDIGKIIIEQENNEKNAEKGGELYSEHPVIGHTLMDEETQLSPLETQIINQHHERQDGKGFPKGLKGQNRPLNTEFNRTTKGSIFRFAEVCSVANAFDNLAHDPKKKGQICVEKAVKQIMHDAGTKYNKEIVSTLMKVVPCFPVGSMVKVVAIDDPAFIGFFGVVAKSNEDTVEKPVIILTRNKYMKKIKPTIIDTGQLSKVDLQLIF